MTQPLTKEQLREELATQMLNLKATSINAYRYFNGQEIGDDPVMDKYWKQENKAEDEFYDAMLAAFTTQLQPQESYNQRVVNNVVGLAQASLPGSWLDPVSGKKMYNEAHLQAVRKAVEAEIEKLRQDEHPTEDGVPVETYGYEATHNKALDECKAAVDKVFPSS